jgi:hypothetical protein
VAARDTPTCNKWMPRAKDYCARRLGHTADCRTAKALESSRVPKTARRRGVLSPRKTDPAAAARWRRTHHLNRYGLTREQFDQLLDEQGHACAMCLSSFEDGQKVCIDHDHACCPDGKRSCGNCIRGLLCNDCNTALGQIEKKYEMARAYLEARKPRRGRDSGACLFPMAS